MIETFVLQVLDYADLLDAPNSDEVPIEILKIDDQQFWSTDIAGDDVVLIATG